MAEEKEIKDLESLCHWLDVGYRFYWRLAIDAKELLRKERIQGTDERECVMAKSIDEEVHCMNVYTAAEIILDSGDQKAIDDMWELLLYGVEAAVRASAAKGKTLNVPDGLHSHLEERRRVNPRNRNESRL